MDSMDLENTENTTLVPFEDVHFISDDRKSVDMETFKQPKTVTNAVYSFSRLHYRMFVHIREELSLYIQKNYNFINSKELIQIPLFINHYPHFKGSNRAFYDAVSALQLRQNVIHFTWRFDAQRHADLYRWMTVAGTRREADSSRIQLPRDGAIFEQSSVLIVNVLRCLDDPNKLVVDINPKLVPFLLYYGKGNGGTTIERDVALKLGCKYSAFLYEHLMDWSSSVNTVKMGFEELRKMLGFPDNYKGKEIRRRVLDPCVQQLEEAGAGILFDYELKFDPDYGYISGTRGRFPANCVVFHISRRESVDWNEINRKEMLVMLQSIADKGKSRLCEDLAVTIVKNGRAAFLRAKFQYYNSRVEKGKMTTAGYLNTMRKIVREETGVDLRSDTHIRNAKIAEKRRPRPKDKPEATVGSFAGTLF